MTERPRPEKLDDCDTEPAPPPDWEHHGSPVPPPICVVCDGMHGDHDPACPMFHGVEP